MNPSAAGTTEPRDGARAGSPRIAGIDLARTAAIAGMTATHLVPGVRDGVATWSATVTGGRSAALFAVLAGVGLTLTARPGPADGDRPRRAVSAAVATRAVGVGLLGLLVLTVVPTGLAIILASYGLLFLVGVPLLWLRTRTLVVLAVLWPLASPVAGQLLRPHLPPGPGAQPTLLALAHPVRLLETLGVTGYYPVLTWISYLLAGMVAGRLDLRRARTAVGLAVSGAALALAAWAVAALALGPLGGLAALRSGEPVRRPALDLNLRLTQTAYGATPTDSWWWLAVRQQHSGTPPDLVGTTGTALAALGACLLLAAAAVRAGTLLRAVLTAAAAPGSMPLTVYCAHVVAVAVHPHPDRPVLAWLGQLTVAVLVATLWRTRVGRGPLERLVGMPAARARLAVAGTPAPATPA